ncbi:XRE family transcriptional regulator, partial [Cupriavidus sp. SK-4]|uniref:IS110 family transposase n=1 Tax=Cupriavidus sp. SK-4 TaxID=574750 RepID=UPI000446CCBD
MNATTYGLDLAKSIFQLYWVDPETSETHSRRLSKTQLISFLSNRTPGKFVLEACGGAHWWARKFISLGHEAILLHPKYVRPFVRTNKTDAADARAIWTAAQQPGMRPIPVKTEAQQALLGLHRIRSELVDSRTRQVNQIRGLLGEYGLHFVLGRKA